MRDIIFFLVAFSLAINTIHSQVGIGTTNPTAQLEIESSNGGIPALEINPQVSPIGSADGQLAVIGDKLYMYDAARAKWLSIEITTLPFGRSGNNDATNLRATGNQGSNRSGYLMPYNGTITYASIKTNNTNGAQSKQFSIQVRNGNTTTNITSITTTASQYSNTNLNIDFSAGDYLNSRIDNDGNGNVNNVSLILWVKWRQ